MVFINKDKVIIKFLQENKRYDVRCSLSEFLTKGQSFAGLCQLLKKIDISGTSKCQKGWSGASCIKK